MKALAKLSPELKKKLATAISGNYKTSGGSNSHSSSDEPDFVMPTFGNNEQKNEEGGVEVLSFAEQAVSKADVNNNPETPIFEIISNRYMRSAWKKLDTEGK